MMGDYRFVYELFDVRDPSGVAAVGDLIVTDSDGERTMTRTQCLVDGVDRAGLLRGKRVGTLSSPLHCMVVKPDQELLVEHGLVWTERDAEA